MSGLALDPERPPFGARAHGVHRSLQRLATSSPPRPGAAEWSNGGGAVDGDATDTRETPRPSRRTLARVRARGMSKSRKRTLQVFEVIAFVIQRYARALAWSTVLLAFPQRLD